MATIRIDRGFTQKTQQNVLSHKPSQPQQAPKRKKTKSGPSALTVALIAVGALVLVAGVGIVVAVSVSNKPVRPKPAEAVQELSVTPPASAPVAPPTEVAKKAPPAARPPVSAPPVQARVRTGFSGQGADFSFDSVPKPAANDAAASARFALVDSEMDRSSGGPSALNDGRIPPGKDQSKNNFFFRKGLDGGRLMVDLGRTVSVKQVNTYSWHTGMRGPQVYVLYGGDDEAKEFVVDPGRSVDPATAGWRRLAAVDTRSQSGSEGGQHGVSIGAENGTLGSYRFLLFVAKAAEMNDELGNTFYSEIDVVDADSTASLAQAKAADSVHLFGDREVAQGSPQGLFCEFYDSVTGSVVEDLRKAAKFPASPDWTLQAKKFELPEKLGERYGARVRGYLVPPKSGTYTFWLNVDDGGEFWLSTDETPASLKKQITVTKVTRRKWTTYAEQQSAPCELVAGQRYYLEAFVKQATGEDYLAVGWSGPVSEQPVIIDSPYLQPWKGESN